MPITTPPVFFSGREGACSVDGVSEPTSNWKVGITRTRVDCTYMKESADDALAWRDFISGFKEGSVSMRGPYDPSIGLPFNSPSAAYDCLIGSTFRLSGNMAVTRIDIEHDVESKAVWVVEGAMQGAPTLGVAISGTP